MPGPTIDPSEIGTTGIIWLLISYGYALYYASDLIGQGSELLLLVPSMAGLVGGVVLPLLGAVPDGAIILFSGLGSIDEAQETLSVGVGALAGSTIMLLTVPWALSIYAGRVDLNPARNNRPDYFGIPKLSDKVSWQDDIFHTGVTVTESVQRGGIIMALTTLPYFLIQVPALFLHGPSEDIAKGEHWWALSGLIVCLLGLTYYMYLQLQNSQAGQDRDKRIAVMKKVLKEGKVSLSGACAATIREARENDAAFTASGSSGGQYDSLTTTTNTRVSESSLPFGYPPPTVADYLKDILIDAFKAYDTDRSGQLERIEIRMFFKDFHENISEEEMDKFLFQADTDGDGNVSFQEFIGLAYNLIMSHDDQLSKAGATSSSGGQYQNDTPATPGPGRVSEARKEIIDNIWKGEGEGSGELEEEEVPEEFSNLSPDEQQTAIKRKAFQMLALGTVLVVYFSDPMVDVMQEIAIRANLPPFYVSFVLAPLASNASEVLASMYYASKKTRKTITVSLSALEGAACMNNTFCLSIFMGLIFIRGLAWQYTAETMAIVIVEVIMAVLVQNEVMSTARALGILCIFPLSLVLVATLEHLGFD